jgi:hypothetical protein
MLVCNRGGHLVYTNLIAFQDSINLSIVPDLNSILGDITATYQAANATIPSRRSFAARHFNSRDIGLPDFTRIADVHGQSSVPYSRTISTDALPQHTASPIGTGLLCLQLVAIPLLLGISLDTLLLWLVKVSLVVYLPSPPRVPMYTKAIRSVSNIDHIQFITHGVLELFRP